METLERPEILRPTFRVLSMGKSYSSMDVFTFIIICSMSRLCLRTHTFMSVQMELRTIPP